jgi:hypothetical protein
MLIHWHSHIHAIVAEGVFTENGHFIYIPDIWKHRAAELWRERVFGLLLDEMKINETVAASMRGWKHSGFSVDNSVSEMWWRNADRRIYRGRGYNREDTATM